MADIPSINVWAANENVQKYVTHPTLRRVKFPDDISQPAFWPLDSFTMRLIRDGEVLTEGPATVDTPPPLEATAPKRGKKE